MGEEGSKAKLYNVGVKVDKDRTLQIFDRLLMFGFFLLAAGISFSNAITEIAAATIIGSWIIKRVLEKNSSFPGGKPAIILALFLLWSLLSFINTGYLNESVRGLLKSVKHFLIFIACVDYLDSSQKVRKVLLFMIGFGYLIALNGIIQYITGTDLIRHRTIDPLDYLYRVSSSFRHANDFGAYLIVIITIMLSLFFSRSRRFKERVLVTIVTVTLAWCLVATGSRGAWLGFIVAFLFLSILKSKKLLVFIVLIIILAPIFLPTTLKGRFEDFANLGKEGTTWERMRLWAGTIDMIKEHPFLGFGVNTYTKNFPKYKPKDYPDIRYTHNSYLHMASETGIVGAGIFIIFLTVLLASAIRSIKIFEKGLNRDLFIGIIAGSVGFLAHCAVDTHLYSVTLSAFLFLCLGLTTALKDNTCKQRI